MCLGPEIALVAQIIGATAAAGGTAISVVGAQQQAEASEKAEKERQKQMRLQALQQRREAIRKFQLARATTLSNVSGATGSLQGSAAPGAISGYTSNLGTELGEIGQAEEIGQNIFQANADYASASSTVAAGQGISSFGKQLFGSGPAIGRIGSTLFNRST